MTELGSQRHDIPSPDRGRSGNVEFTILNKPSYIEELGNLIPKAEKRVWIQTMTFDGNGPFLDLKQLMVDSAARDVDTRFTVDMYHKLLVAGRPYYLPGILPKTREKQRTLKDEKKDALRELKDNNVLVTITNPPTNIRERINPARGRNHIKMAIIDDVAYVGDLHNFVSKNQPGIVVKTTDPMLVEGLASIYLAAPNGRIGADYEILGSDGTSLLVDTGVPHQSLILDRSVEAVDRATASVRMHTQHTPDGKILDALQRAQDRELPVSAAIADPNIVFRPLSRVFDARGQIKFKRAGYTAPVLEIPDWVHSNILLIDEGLSTTQVFVGTRCYSDTLADWGTNEVALQSQNADLLEQLTAHVDQVEAKGALRDPQRTLSQIVFPR